MMKTYRFVFKSPEGDWEHNVRISEEEMKKALSDESVKKYNTPFDFLVGLGFTSISSKPLTLVEEVNGDRSETICKFQPTVVTIFKSSYLPDVNKIDSETGFLGAAVETIKNNNIKKLWITKIKGENSYILMYTHNQVAFAMLDSDLEVKVASYQELLSLLIKSFPEFVVSVSNLGVTLEKRSTLLNKFKVARIDETSEGWSISGLVTESIEKILENMRSTPEFILSMGYRLRVNPATEEVGTEGNLLYFSTAQKAIDFIEIKLPSVTDILINRMPLASKLNLLDIEQSNIQTISVWRGTN